MASRTALSSSTTKMVGGRGPSRRFGSGLPRARGVGRALARARWIRLSSSLAFTGLFRCRQPPWAISRKVSVEMSPVRMIGRDLVTERLPQAGDDLQAVQTVRQIVVGDDEVRTYRPARRQFQRLSAILDGRSCGGPRLRAAARASRAPRDRPRRPGSRRSDVRFRVASCQRCSRPPAAARPVRAAPRRRRPSPCPDGSGHRRRGPAGLPGAATMARPRPRPLLRSRAGLSS